MEQEKKLARDRASIILQVHDEAIRYPEPNLFFITLFRSLR